jgi:hypothetical protein
VEGRQRARRLVGVTPGARVGRSLERAAVSTLGLALPCGRRPGLYIYTQSVLSLGSLGHPRDWVGALTTDQGLGEPSVARGVTTRE